MNDFKIIFFPDPEYTLVASLCYLLIFLTAYKRYNALIINYGAYDAPETARPWTTWLRYHGSAIIYACVYAIFFAVLYQLFHRHPLLIDAAKKVLGNDNPFAASLEEIGKDIKLLSPVLALILLTWGAEKYRKTTAADRRLRYFFQQMGSIPSAVSRTIRNFKRYELEVDTEECIGDLPEKMRDLIALPVLQKDPKSLEHLYLRACHLLNTIEHWNSISSDFYSFQNAYRQAYENIRNRYGRIKRNAKRYYQLKLKSDIDAHLYEQNPERLANTRFDSIYPKVLTELRKDLRNDLKNILENIYLYVACAVHSKGLTAKKRNKLLASFGFRIADAEKSSSRSVDPNDMSILAVFLVFVIPLSALFAGFAGDKHMGMIKSLTYVVWSAMALFVGLISVAVPIMVKQVKTFSDHPFWKSIRPKKGHAWCAYMVSGVSAGAAGIVVIFLLHFLAPDRSLGTVPERLLRTIPWGLVPLSIAFTLGYHLDRKTIKGTHTTIVETLTTMSAAVLAAVLASAINAGIIKWDELLPRMIFSVMSSALLGGMIGAVIPKRCRGHITKRTKVTLAEVDLKELVNRCMEKFSERAKKENVTLSSSVASNLPVLRIDADKIMRAINGLLSNALEFTPADGKIDVRVGLQSQGGVQLSVKDNGIGMSNHIVKSITDTPPELVHAAWKHVGEFENANLIQIWSIFEKHGGSFELKSRQWEGSEIIVDLPKERVCSEISSVMAETPINVPLKTVAV
jgi:hypothetical protein